MNADSRNHVPDLQGRNVARAGAPIMPAAKLPAHLLQNARILPDRTDILPLLPKGKVFVEVGVAFGQFTDLILEICQPSLFIAIDLFRLHELETMWGRPTAEWLDGKDHLSFYRDKYRDLIEAGRMQVLAGDSAEMLASLPDGSIDILYLDADHTYEGVKRDLAALAPKLHEDGILIANDYTMVEVGLSGEPYGVIQAVNEFMIAENWEMIYFALQNYMYCDVALRRARPEGASPRLPGDAAEDGGAGETGTIETGRGGTARDEAARDERGVEQMSRFARLLVERADLLAERNDLLAERDRLGTERNALRARLAAAEDELQALRADNAALRAALAALHASRSWRLTAPLRRLAALLDGGRGRRRKSAG